MRIDDDGDDDDVGSSGRVWRQDASSAKAELLTLYDAMHEFQVKSKKDRVHPLVTYSSNQIRFEVIHPTHAK